VWHGLVDNDQWQASYLTGDEFAELKFWLGDEAAEAAVAAAATGPVGVSAPTAAPSTAPSSVRQRAHAISTRAAHGAKARG